MIRRTTRLTLLLAGLLLVPAAARAQDDAAGSTDKKESSGRQEKRSTLEDKIRPVSGHLFLKEQRFELTPALGISLADAFFQKYSLGAKATYHFAETLSVGAHASYSLNFAGGALSVCRAGSGCAQPDVGDLKDVPGKVDLL
ncbi:MAG: hypothetical protein ACK4N5_05005, partial [Myxococcales bacterium]